MYKLKSINKLKSIKFWNFFTVPIVKQIFIGAIFVVALYFILIDNIAPEKISVKVGDIAPIDIRATKDIIDEEATEKLKQEAMSRVEPRHKIDHTIQIKSKNEVKSFFDLVFSLKSINNNDNESVSDKGTGNISNENNIEKEFDKENALIILKEKSNIILSDENYHTAINLNNERLLELQDTLFDIVNQIMGTGIQEEELEYEKENVKKIFETMDNFSEEEKKLGINIADQVIKPNRFLDVETTEEKKREAAENIEPVIIKENQLIVMKGDTIDSKTLELIRSTGLLKEKEGIDYKIIIGTLLIVLLITFIIGLYLYLFHKEVLKSVKLVILAIIILSVILICQGVYGISKYLLPISAASMLIAIIIDTKLAVLVNFILVIIVNLIMREIDTPLTVMLLIGGSVGAFSVIHALQRFNIFLTGLIVGLINMLTLTAFGLINNLEFKEILFQSIYGILNGAFSAILTIGTLPLWESVFGILTPVKLLELSNPNQPLLKKLLMEAPGTYHHSILVGNLSEAAAEAIGCNSLIARVGAYYHDVGKLKRPYFFKENQFNIENPHDKLNPSLSTLIITKHTKEGEEIASKYKLPQKIKDIILQHHGQTVVAYFYHKAKQNKNGEDININDFRYEGPKPQSKEAAIIMIADSVEAATRAMKEPTKDKIEATVKQIIKDKLNDGQLEECDLTLRDLNTIANSFLNILLGIFHERIEYPELNINEIKGEC